jgi:para-aminobenzoate synthetase component 1
MGLKVQPCPYRPDGSELFAPLASRDWAVFLDSCGTSAGRWDIIACKPRITLQTRGDITEIASEGRLRSSRDDPFDLLRELLGPLAQPANDLPFCGGAIGYLSYDLGRRIERLPATAADPLGLPEMSVGIYDSVLLVDHREARVLLVGRDDFPSPAWALLAGAASGVARPKSHPFLVTGPLMSNMDEQGYAERFRRVQDYIRNGDCYQINLARRFSVAASGDPWAAYRELRARNPAPFAAYLNTPAVRVLCSSPERFLHVDGDRVETCPIKGTRARSRIPHQDLRRRVELAGSTKDRAENLMIVDLLRNDLGRSCAVGSIRVPELFDVESFAGVHHLVSRITGRLAPGQDALSLLRACFPGGSITGAPKIRAMEIIEELEGERRSVYCGSIFRLGFDGRLDSNIAIRTMIHTREQLRFWAGGGIVADSSCTGESDEIAVKARSMHEVVEQFRAGSDALRLC